MFISSLRRERVQDTEERPQAEGPCAEEHIDGFQKKRAAGEVGLPDARTG